MILFKLLAFIFIFGLIAIIVTVIGFWVRVRNMVDQLRGGASQNTRRTATRNDGEEVIDSRNQQQADRKIFSKDEGEYVDFTEEE